MMDIPEDNDDYLVQNSFKRKRGSNDVQSVSDYYMKKKIREKILRHQEEHKDEDKWLSQNGIKRRYDLNGTPYYTNMYGVIIKYGNRNIGDEIVPGFKIAGFSAAGDYEEQYRVHHYIISSNIITNPCTEEILERCPQQFLR